MRITTETYRFFVRVALVDVKRTRRDDVETTRLHRHHRFALNERTNEPNGERKDESLAR